MRITVLIVASLLCGCGHAERVKPRPARDLGITLAPTVTILPVVKLHIIYKRDWCDLYTTEEEDVDVTLLEAKRMGLPGELWVFLALFGTPDHRQTIYFVRPLRA